jgi:HSP20 family protein
MTLLRWTPMKKAGCMSPFYGRRLNRHDNDKQVVRRENDVISRYPATDIYDTDEYYVLKMEVPGFSKSEIDIEFKDSVLTVKGERKEEKEKEDKDVSYHWTERRHGNFSRSFRLPKDVDGKKIDAILKSGVLELKIAKPEEKKPRNIPITFN